MLMQRWMAGLVLLCGTAAPSVHGQTAAKAVAVPAAPMAGQVDLEVGYIANPNNQTNGARLLLQGGGAELAAYLPHHFAGVASFTGLHTGATGTGVPQNLLIATFGPRFTYADGRGRTSIFVQGLVGEANGFDGVFPATAGASSSASSLAIKVGGGIDVAVRRHIRVRALQLDFLQTQLPNGTTNVQRSVLIGAGIVWHTLRQ